MNFDTKIALITGGSHGIGKATALALAEAGADVVITYRGRSEGAQDTARQIEGLGQRALVLQADVTLPDDCSRIVEETIQKFDGLHVVINNAGGAHGTSLLDLTLADWHYTLDLCVTAPFLVAQNAAKQMVATGHGGAIVNISSVHSSHVWPNRAAYGVAKAALNRLTKSMAVEWAPLGIRVNTIAPGYTNVAETEEEQSRYESTDQSSAPWIVAQRTARPSEIAKAAVFLASDDASYVTGQTLFVDGGLLLPPVTTADYMKGNRTAGGFVG